jgi:hypothetical protein
MVLAAAGVDSGTTGISVNASIAAAVKVTVATTDLRISILLLGSQRNLCFPWRASMAERPGRRAFRSDAVRKFFREQLGSAQSI